MLEKMNTIADVEKYLVECVRHVEATLRGDGVKCSLELTTKDGEGQIELTIGEQSRTITVFIADDSPFKTPDFTRAKKITETFENQTERPAIKLKPVGENSRYPEECYGAGIFDRLPKDVLNVVNRERQVVERLKNSV